MTDTADRIAARAMLLLLEEQARQDARQYEVAVQAAMPTIKVWSVAIGTYHSALIAAGLLPADMPMPAITATPTLDGKSVGLALEWKPTP